MPGDRYEKVFDLAADQHGLVTTSQARDAGVSKDAIRMMVRRGTLERVSRGVYRVPGFPVSPLAEFMEASLWPAGARGIVSHESALALFGLSDVSPSSIHITLPTEFRVRRDVPSHLVLHHADLAMDDVELFEGIPATTPRRSIEDCHRTHLGPELLRQAISDAEREGHLTPAEARDLRRALSTPGGDPESGG